MTLTVFFIVVKHVDFNDSAVIVLSQQQPALPTVRTILALNLKLNSTVILAPAVHDVEKHAATDNVAEQFVAERVFVDWLSHSPSPAGWVPAPRVRHHCRRQPIQRTAESPAWNKCHALLPSLRRSV